MTTEPQEKPAIPQELQGLTEGRIVHYVLDEGPYKGQHRPAIVVRVWNQYTGYVNLQVFVDGTNDAPNNQHPSDIDQAYYNGVMWVTSVCYSATKETRTWHWIERA